AAEKVWGERHFFDASNPAVQVMSARADHDYAGVGLERTMLLIRDARLSRPTVVDLFRVTSAADHAYDYPIHFRGQLISTSVKYTANVKEQSRVGSGFGYEHLWREASAQTNATIQLTWLD